MSRSRRGRRALRATRVESVEPRLLMSADGLDELALDYVVEGTSLDDVEVSLVGVDELTGLTSVRTDYGFSGAGQTVVVIDTGIAYEHVALGGGLGADYRVVGGYDFGDRDADPDDDSARASHGTHVAGIIASADPTHAGVAPGVDLVALKVFDSNGQSSLARVEEALRWVHDHRNDFANPITTVNLSLGVAWNGSAPPNWATLEEEFAQLEADGIFVAVAAGNSFTSYNAPGLAYPAASPHVVPVASVDPSGQLSYYSQRDARVIAAPGRGITSTVPDALGNKNGLDDDFAKYSGTSMAAPYVAAASVLLREAYEFVGVSNVLPARLYDLMCQTADTVFDSVTGQSYYRLNLARAIDAIMPADDFGSTAASAHALGTITDTCAVSGSIERLGDQDWFRFTAGRTGVVSFAVEGTHAMDAAWQAGGGAGLTIQDGVAMLDVVAGRTYSIALGTSAGIGNYTVTAELKAAGPETVAWGKVDQATFAARAAAAGSWFSLTASQTGILTVEAFAGKDAGNARFEVYDAQNRLLGEDGGSGRVDVRVAAGDQILVRAVYTGRGTSGQVDFRVTNLVSQIGAVVYVRGTAGDDVFHFAAGKTHQINVNGAAYSFDAAAVGNVQIDGRGGADRATLVGTAAAESAAVRATSARLRGSGYQVNTKNIEAHTVQGGAGADTAVFYDSAGDDAFTAAPAWATFIGLGFSNRAEGFEKVYAVATAGGNDVAQFHDSAGNDVFVVTTAYAKLYNASLYLRAEGFHTVRASAGAGGRDRAYVRDTPGDDVLVAAPQYTTLEGGGFSFRVDSFEEVWAYALDGGRDVARMLDSAGNDALALGVGEGRLRGQGFDNRAKYFEHLAVEATAGGRDTAQIVASGRTTRLEAAAALLRLLGETTTAEIYGFEGVRAQIVNGARCTRETNTLDYVLDLLNS
ncbi:MAG: S8 family serine peptidase [Pirellulales bacterium]|nr:S8 family serine peptidase [Pirellulales bacterium]